MIKTKVSSCFNMHKHIIILSVFLIFLVSTLLFLPSFALADPLGIANNFKEGIVTFIVSIGSAATKYSFMFLKLAMQTSTDLISDVVNEAPAYSDQANVGLSFTTAAGMVREMALSFLGILVIIIAFSQVLHVKVDEWGAKALLPKLFLASLMSLFSLFICSVIYDFALVVTNAFALNTNVNVDKATALAVSPVAKLWEAFTDGELRLNIMAAIIFLGTCILLSIGYLILAILLFFRTIFVLILMAISPLAFVCMVLPWTNGLYKKWWQMFAKWIFYLPAAYIILNIGTMVMMAILSSSMYTKSIVETLQTNDDFAEGSMLLLGQLFVPSVTALIVMGAAIIIPFSMLGKAGGIASSLAKKAGRTAGMAAYKRTPVYDKVQALKLAGARKDAIRKTRASEELGEMSRRFGGGRDAQGNYKNPKRQARVDRFLGRDADTRSQEADEVAKRLKLGGVSVGDVSKMNAALIKHGGDRDKALNDTSMEKVGKSEKEMLSKVAVEDMADVLRRAIANDKASAAKLGSVAVIEASGKEVSPDLITASHKSIAQSRDSNLANKVKAEHLEAQIGDKGYANEEEAGRAMASMGQQTLTNYYQSMDEKAQAVMARWLKAAQVPVPPATSSAASPTPAPPAANPTPTPPPESGVYHDPADNFHSQPLPGNDEEEERMRRTRNYRG